MSGRTFFCLEEELRGSEPVFLLIVTAAFATNTPCAAGRPGKQPALTRLTDTQIRGAPDAP